MRAYAAREVAALIMCCSSLALAQVSGGPVRASELHLDTLLASAGPSWRLGQSKHFVVYVERDNRFAIRAEMLDSLETAWQSAVALLGAPVADGPRIPVLVTASRTRFPRLLDAQGKGLTTRMPEGGEIIILIRNDSVRAHTRHEVMHVVSQRAWGWGSPARTWLVEGLATFADGRCQTTSITAVARDLFRATPSVTAQDVAQGFVSLWRADRARAYILAGTLVGSLWEGRGREGVRRLWQGVDTLTATSRLDANDPTAVWHGYVMRHAATARSLDTTAFRRLGCG